MFLACMARKSIRGLTGEYYRGRCAAAGGRRRPFEQPHRVLLILSRLEAGVVHIDDPGEGEPARTSSDQLKRRTKRLV